MAQQTINLGTTANDGTGDTLRDAGTKINANFTELYAAPSGGSGGEGYLVDVDTTGATDESATIRAALDAHDIVRLPAGTIKVNPLTAILLVRSGCKLIGAGTRKTILKLATGGYGATSTHILETAQSGVGSQISDLMIDGGYVGHSVIGDPGTAGSRVSGIIARGTQFLIQNVFVKNLWGYAYWPNGGSASTLASGILRNVHCDNANVQFETTHADGVLWDGFTGTSGDTGATPYADLGNEFIHPIVNSNNITYRSGRFVGSSGAPISISTTTAAQKGIVLDDILILRTSTGAGLAAIAYGTATYPLEAKFNNVRIYQAGADSALAVQYATVDLVNCILDGGVVGFNAGVNATVRATATTVRGVGTGAGTGFGIVADPVATVHWDGGKITAIDNGGGAVAINGIVTVGPTTQVSPAGGATPLNLVNGSDGTATTAASPQIFFGYAGSQQYRHAVVSRHNAAINNNAMDFYLHKGGTDAAGAVPTFKGAILDTTGFDLPTTGTGFKVQGTQVVGARQPAIANHASDAKVNEILAALRNHGLIAV